jgi:hypothetical protein
VPGRPESYVPEGHATARDREAAVLLEERKARLAARQADLAALPTVVLKDGGIARSHWIKGAASGTVHAIARGIWRAAFGSALGQAGSWSTALDEAVLCPRCAKKIAG